MHENKDIVHQPLQEMLLPPGQIEVIKTPSNHPMSLIELAIQGDIDADKLDKLMSLQERWDAQQAKKAFYNAFSNFQSDLPIINKKGKVDFEHKQGGGRTQYNYARLEDIETAIKPLLGKHSLSYRFEQINTDSITVKCIITHRDGHSESNKLTAFPDQSGKKNPLQATSSTVSYLRRYTLTGGFGICVSEEDDDAQNKENEPKKPNKNDFYPNEEFKKNLPNWKARIAQGQDPDNIIKFLCAKNKKLSPAQIKRLKSK
jgi:hypothetical protein